MSVNHKLRQGGRRWESFRLGRYLRVRAPLLAHRTGLPLVVPHEPVVDGPLAVAELRVPGAELLQPSGFEQRRLH